MSASPLRVTFVLTHPAQYQAPWLRYLAAHVPALDITVLYGAMPTPEQQGAGFGTSFTWDVPLTEGYAWQLCAGAAVRTVHSGAFFGVDVPRIQEPIAATSPDVVVVTGWHTMMQVRALRACRRLGIPVVYRGDSTLVSGPRRFVWPLWRVKTHVMLRQFSGYLSVGTQATRYLRSFGVPAERIVPSPHCVDNDRFRAAAVTLSDRRLSLRAALGVGPEDFVVVFAGKFVDVKRPLDAVRAVSRLGRDAVLMMCGDGPLGDAARAEAQRLGVRVVWRGFLNQSLMPEAFAAADALLMTSRWETWGLIINEALASGRPCVVTDTVGAAPDLVIDGATGFTAPVGDIDAIADRLGRLRDAIRSGVDVATACLRHVERCSFAEAARGLVTAADALTTGVRHPVARTGSHVA